MSDVLTSVRLPPEAPVFERPRSVPSFLAESQCRVIEHCRLLLKSQDLAAERRQRLTGWSKWPKPNCSVYTP